jgi:hypothetical protein
MSGLTTTRAALLVPLAFMLGLLASSLLRLDYPSAVTISREPPPSYIVTQHETKAVTGEKSQVRSKDMIA